MKKKIERVFKFLNKLVTHKNQKLDFLCFKEWTCCKVLSVHKKFKIFAFDIIYDYLGRLKLPSKNMPSSPSGRR